MGTVRVTSPVEVTRAATCDAVPSTSVIVPVGLPDVVLATCAVRVVGWPGAKVDGAVRVVIVGAEVMVRFGMGAMV